MAWCFSSHGAEYTLMCHDDIIKWKHVPRYWPFVQGSHRSPVNSPHKGQGRGALMFSLICVWIKNHWVNNREAGDMRLYRAHYDIIVMFPVVYGIMQAMGCLVFLKAINCTCAKNMTKLSICRAAWLQLKTLSEVRQYSNNHGSSVEIQWKYRNFNFFFSLKKTYLEALTAKWY